MNVTFEAMTPEAARELTTWRYPAPYETYNVNQGDASAEERNTYG